MLQEIMFLEFKMGIFEILQKKSYVYINIIELNKIMFFDMIFRIMNDKLVQIA